MRTPTFYRFCDGVSEVLLLFAAVFYPWAFGTTERWSIRIMNDVGYALGFLLVCKWIVRWRTGYIPPRWSNGLGSSELKGARVIEGGGTGESGGVDRWVTRGLAFATGAVLTVCFLGAVNARMVYAGEGTDRYARYLESIEWLPRSYDQTATWLAFWSYLGLACVFWSARDLLLAKSALERRVGRDIFGSVDSGPPPFFLPERLRRLLWLIFLNGAWLGLVSIFQRLDGTDKLLWLMERQGDYPVEFSFGPFAYRGNAAQFFNLLWPACLGFWWMYGAPLRREIHEPARAGTGPHVLLLPAAVVMASCPILSGHAGGAWISLVALPLVFAVILGGGHGRRVMSAFMCLLAVLVVLAGLLGWDPIGAELPRPGGLAESESAALRASQNQTTATMIRDHPWLGVGPYAYRSAYGYYRETGQPVFSFAHNDWLQTIAEWGAPAALLVFAMLSGCLMRPWVVGAGHVVFVGVLMIGFLSTLGHAAFDFPLQIQALLFLHVLLCAVLVSLPVGRVSETVVGPRD